MNPIINCFDYQLIETGDGWRFERFGDLILKRPSRLAIWQLSSKSRSKTDFFAEYEHKQGWRFNDTKKEGWEISLTASDKGQPIKLKLRFQNNGQIGFFPEHLSYLDQIRSHLANLKTSNPDEPVSVLNLYAFTGMASLVSALYSDEVTHVDILQAANNWAKENYEINKSFLSPVKFITEDAVKYCTRAANRGDKFDLIISDPPSFSRTGKNSNWNLEENLASQIKLYKSLMSSRGMLILTSHLYEFGNLVMENLCRDIFGADAEVSSEQLYISEAGRDIKFPAGFMVKLERRRLAC